MVLVGSISGWDICWSGFTIKALKSSMPRFWSGRCMKELLYPFISCSLNILLVENYKDGFWVAQSNRFQHLAKPFFFLSLLEGPPISALLHPCRLAHVMTQLDIVCSCAKLFIQLFWMRARCKMKSTLCILNFAPILHKLVVGWFVSSLCNKLWPSYLILGRDVWSCVKRYVDIPVGTFW